MATASVDLKRALAPLYTAPTTPTEVTAPAYQDAVSTLYAVSYGLRAMAAAAGATHWTVMPLEGLWWSADLASFSVERRQDWLWTMLVVQPDLVDEEMVERATRAAAAKKKAPSAGLLRREILDEGQALHVLHLGPYAAEAPTIAALHEAITARGLMLRGHHHEVYLGDPRRVAPDRMRTIIRQPVAQT